MSYPYEVAVHWAVTSICNFQCDYCISKAEDGDAKKLSPIPVETVIETLDKTGKTFKFLMTGGEPFIIPNAVELYLALSQKHLLAFHSNFSAGNIEEFFSKVDPKQIDYVHASLHIEELLSKKLLERYARNFAFCKSKGICIESVAVGHPRILSKADEYRELLKKYDIELMFSMFIGEYNGKQYPESYTSNELAIIREEERSSFQEDFYFKGQTCVAGYNGFVIHDTGDLNPCYDIDVDCGNIFSGIHFLPKPMTCPAERCSCPYSANEPILFEQIK